jgi:hypothetical protein
MACFHGMPCVLLTVTRPAAPVGDAAVVGYLPDGDDYIVLAAEADTSLLTALRAATAATAECANQQIPVDIAMLTGEAQPCRLAPGSHSSRRAARLPRQRGGPGRASDTADRSDEGTPPSRPDP